MDFIIADIRLSIPRKLISDYFAEAMAPFEAHDEGTPDLRITPIGELHSTDDYRPLEHFQFSEAEAQCDFGREADGYFLKMIPHDTSYRAVCFRISEDGSRVETDYTLRDLTSLFRFGVWVAYNCCSIRRKTVAIHSSVIVYRGQGLLMLGESGTGKSTHTRLWREHIEGARLLNDDSPIVRANSSGGGSADCHSTVYGSAWSGKTPCYINRHFPIRAFIRLSQAPYNKIRRLNRLETIGALLPSCPPAFSHDKQLFDHVCATVSSILEHTEVYHLECLPNADAARLVCQTLFKDENN